MANYQSIYTGAEIDARLGKAGTSIQGVKVNNTELTPDADKKVNVTVPTKTSDLTNDSGFLTQHQSLADYRTSAQQDVIDATKVDKVTGKGLSTNDFTTEEKTKLAGLHNYDDTALSGRVTTIEGKEAGWDAKYAKPSGGIPDTDMAEDVQTSLELADTALQSSALTPYRTSAAQDVIDATKASASDVDAIEEKIPAQATSENQLADKNFVNSSINSVAAYYITADASGNAFATKAALLVGPYYNQGQIRVLTRNDYALVNADETHDNAACRYVYDGAVWAFQYKVNDTPLTAAQLAAINSGITASLVTAFGAKYSKPASGIPESDLADAVKAGLVMVATYGSTTYAEVVAAKNANKEVLVVHQDRYYRLYTIDANVAYFTALGGTYIAMLYLSNPNTWSMVSATLETAGNKETTTASFETNKANTSKYPSNFVVDSLFGRKVSQITIADSVATQMLEPNTLYVFATRSSDLALTFGTAISGIANEYNFIITIDSTTLPTISGLSGITWNGGSAPAFALGKKYEVSICEGVGVFIEI